MVMCLALVNTAELFLFQLITPISVLVDYKVHVCMHVDTSPQNSLARNFTLSLQVGQKSNQISALKSDISTVDKLSQEANRRVQNEASRQQSTDLVDYKNQKEKLVTEINELTKTLDTLVANNRESELQLRKVNNPINPHGRAASYNLCFILACIENF